jgi:hypothetical protein
MKLLLIPLLLILSSCAMTKQPQPTDVADTAIVAPTVSQELTGPMTNNLFSEAHRCQGTVKYQAEMQNAMIRSRLTCEWEVSPDEWGTWSE